MLKYDMLHNFDIVGKIGHELFDKVSQISGVITPLEYGCDQQTKIELGLLIS